MTGLWPKFQGNLYNFFFIFFCIFEVFGIILIGEIAVTWFPRPYAVSQLKSKFNNWKLLNLFWTTFVRLKTLAWLAWDYNLQYLIWWFCVCFFSLINVTSLAWGVPFSTLVNILLHLIRKSQIAHNYPKKKYRKLGGSQPFERSWRVSGGQAWTPSTYSEETDLEIGVKYLRNFHLNVNYFFIFFQI